MRYTLLRRIPLKKLYIYQGLDNEEVPEDVTHVIVDSSVKVIKAMAFYECKHLVSAVMGDNVKRIEEFAFFHCHALRYIQLSNTLKDIGEHAFCHCESLEALFLPSAVKSIEYGAFYECYSLRLLILPHDIDLGNVGGEIINQSFIHSIAARAGMTYQFVDRTITYNLIDESNRQVNEWLFHHMDGVPFHKLCYTSSITTRTINNYLNENGNDSALAIDAIHGMNPLHILAMNLHAPADAIAALLDVNMEAAFCVDNLGKLPLECAREYNIDGLVGMIKVLCNHKRAARDYVEKKERKEEAIDQQIRNFYF